MYSKPDFRFAVNSGRIISAPLRTALLNEKNTETPVLPCSVPTNSCDLPTKRQVLLPHVIHSRYASQGYWMNIATVRFLGRPANEMAPQCAALFAERCPPGAIVRFSCNKNYTCCRSVSGAGQPRIRSIATIWPLW